MKPTKPFKKTFPICFLLCGLTLSQAMSGQPQGSEEALRRIVEKAETFKNLKSTTYIGQGNNQVAYLGNYNNLYGLEGHLTLGPSSGNPPMHEAELSYWGLNINWQGKRVAFLGKNRGPQGGISQMDLGRRDGTSAITFTGEGTAQFYNRSRKEIIYIGTDRSENAVINVNTRNAGSAISLSGTGDARFYNSSGRQVVFVGSNSGGDAQLDINVRNERKAITLSGDGVARFYNPAGRVVVYLGLGTQQGREVGVLQINSRNVGDYAEVFEFATHEGVIPGTLMSMAEDGSGLTPSNTAYDPKVVGAVSGAGGLTAAMQIGARKDGTDTLPIAISGQVYVRVCMDGGPLKVGDLLVSSNRNGIAMRAADHNRAFGAVIGKALEPYSGKEDEGEGLVRILVMSR